MTTDPPPPTERPVGLVRGTRDHLPADAARLRALEARLLDGYQRAGYEPIRTPVLEFAELHERKSGAGIVAKLDELADGHLGRVCLRPELTAGIVRAYVDAPACPPLPWRVFMAGPVFRHQTLGPGLDRQFTQVGVERIGDGGPAADAEILWLADWSLRQLGIPAPAIRLGHVGLILEMLERSGLPHAVRTALVEVISEAASSGGDVRAVETALDRLSGWLLGADPAGPATPAGTPDDAAIARLFRHLVPDVTGRRTSAEILARLRRKWDLGQSLRDVLARLHDQVHALAALRGPAATVVDRLQADFRALAPDSVAELLDLVSLLDDHGVSHDRVELDLGFGRGLGFYTQMIFEIAVPTAGGLIEVCGGGRYDGLARVLGSDRDDRGAGFAFGLERLDQAVRAAGLASPPPAPHGFVIATVPRARSSPSLPTTRAIQLATRIRGLGARACVEVPAGSSETREARHERWRAGGYRYALSVNAGADPQLLDLADPDGPERMTRFLDDNEIDALARAEAQIRQRGPRP